MDKRVPHKGASNRSNPARISGTRPMPEDLVSTPRQRGDRRGFPPGYRYPSLRQYSRVWSSPEPARLITTPNGNFIVRTISTASLRSFKPNGVGSVTSSTKSAPRTLSMTGQDVPGGESTITRSASGAACLTCWISVRAHRLADVEQSPDKQNRPRMPDLECAVLAKDFRDGAGAQTRTQPPQAWHNSG